MFVHDRTSAKQIDNVLKDTPHFREDDRRDGWWNDNSGRFSRFFHFISICVYPYIADALCSRFPFIYYHY